MAAVGEDVDADLAMVMTHVAEQGRLTCKEPEGVLKHKWLIPSGYYQTSCWDWCALPRGTANRVRNVPLNDCTGTRCT